MGVVSQLGDFTSALGKLVRVLYNPFNIMKELAKYLHERIKTEDKVPTEDELAFWIQQHRLRHCAGHYEWNEQFKKNMWIEDK